MFRRNSLEKTIEKAEKYFNKGQMYKARNMYLKALAQDPSN